MVLSLFKIFQFKVNEIYSSFDTSFPFDAYSPQYCGFESSEFIFAKKNCKLFNGFNIVINNLLFLLINLLIDILMIRFTNKNLRRNMLMSTDTRAFSEAVKLKTKVKKIIIANGSLYFLAHIPEFVVTLLLIIFSQKLYDFCNYFFSCTELIGIAEGFNFLSIVFQLFIFLKFDRNFRESFKEMFQMKK